MSACCGGINPQIQKKSIASLIEPIACFFTSKSSLTYLDERKLHAEGIESLIYDWLSRELRICNLEGNWKGYYKR